MAIRRLWGRKAAVATVAAAAVLAGGGGAHAAIPGPDGTITTCYDTTRTLRVFDDGTACPSGSSQLKFNQKGPKGDGFRYRGRYNYSTDEANAYEVGDVVYFANPFPECLFPGSYVKTIKKPANIHNAAGGFCSYQFGWEPMARNGEPGPNNQYWAKFDANGRFLGASHPGTEYYANSSYALVKFPGVDMNKCAITVQPVAADGDPAISTYSNWYGYIYARSMRITTHGPRNNGYVAFDIMANCGMGMNP